MRYVNHDFAKGLARSFLGSEGTKNGRGYIMLVEENKGREFW
jgi:hypothetical protein